jgi:uncharacterized protein (DUF58 family)
MRPTRRGYGLIAVTAVALLLGARFGARSLDALVVPAIAALIVAAVQVSRRQEPSVVRSRPRPGFPGETRTVSLTVKSNLSCDVHERVGPGLRAPNADAQLPGGTEYEYDVGLLERGERTLGPATVSQRDTLGLVAHATDSPRTTPLLVYPEVRPITDRTAFSGLVERAGSSDRDAFDRLREYSSSDSLRDINWKASAKRADQEFVVTEFAAEDEGGITVACEAESGHADAMASAAASVALYLLNADLVVDVAAPGGATDEGRGDEQRTEVLELLARTNAGEVADAHRDRADVLVTAGSEGTTVRVNGVDHSFEELVDTDRETGPEAYRQPVGVVA